MRRAAPADQLAFAKGLPADKLEGFLALPEAERRGGYEIVDKFARKELFIEGALAEQFKVGVDALIESSTSVEEFDAYLEQSFQLPINYLLIQRPHLSL